MELSVSVDIKATPADVWKVITDIGNCMEVISAIEKVEVLENPPSGLIGLKWQETRTMFGKTATETMWITAAQENEYYETRAESHGAIYKTRIVLSPTENGCTLSMTFGAELVTFMAKVMWFIFSGMMKGATQKALQKDLEDIKAHCEK